MRRSISIGTLIGGYDPRNTVDVYDEQSHPTEREFTRIFQPLYGAAHLSFVEGAHYRAIGGRIELAFDISSPIGMTVMLGPNVYKWTRRHATRIDGGLKLTYGVEVVNVALLLERGHQVDASGRFHQRYFVTPGVELTLSNSWCRKLLRLPRRSCCK